MGSSALNAGKFIADPTGLLGINNKKSNTGVPTLGQLGDQDPFYAQLMNSGLFEQGLLDPATMNGKQTDFGGGLQDLRAILGLQAAGEEFSQGLREKYLPGQIDFAGKMAQKDIETLSQLPQYKNFFKTQDLLQQTAQEGLQGSIGDSAEMKDFGNALGTTAARFGLEGSPYAAQGYTKALGGAAEGIRSQRIQQALGVQQGFRIPGSLLGSVKGFEALGTSGAYDIFQGRRQRESGKDQYRLSTQQGYGQLVGSGLNLATSAFGMGGVFGQPYPSGNQG